MKLKLFRISMVLALAMPAIAAAQPWCPNGRCPKPSAPVYDWRPLEGDPDRSYLYYGNVQIGGWCRRAERYQEYEAASGRWGALKPMPPIPPPVQTPAPHPVGPAHYIAGDPPVNYGIDLDKMQKSTKLRYQINGRECERAQAFAAFEAQIPDDADALRLTWVGPPDVAGRVRKDLDGADLAGWKGKLTLQDYPTADVPILRGLGFAERGLHVQSPAGRPLWFCADYGGAGDLAAGLQLADARRRDPNWDPAKWPPLNRAPDPPAKPLDGLRDMSDATAWLKKNWLLVAAAIGGLLLMRRRAPAA